MTSAGPDEGRTTPDLSSWREFAIDGEFCVAEARLETQESLDQYTPLRHRGQLRQPAMNTLNVHAA